MVVEGSRGAVAAPGRHFAAKAMRQLVREGVPRVNPPASGTNDSDKSEHACHRVLHAFLRKAVVLAPA